MRQDGIPKRGLQRALLRLGQLECLGHMFCELRRRYTYARTDAYGFRRDSQPGIAKPGGGMQQALLRLRALVRLERVLRGVRRRRTYTRADARTNARLHNISNTVEYVQHHAMLRMA